MCTLKKTCMYMYIYTYTYTYTNVYIYLMRRCVCGPKEDWNPANGGDDNHVSKWC